MMRFYVKFPVTVHAVDEHNQVGKLLLVSEQVWPVDADTPDQASRRFGEALTAAMRGEVVRR